MKHHTLRTLSDSGIFLCFKSHMAGHHLAAKDSSAWTLFCQLNLNSNHTQRNQLGLTLGHSALYHYGIDKRGSCHRISVMMKIGHRLVPFPKENVFCTAKE